LYIKRASRFASSLRYHFLKVNREMPKATANHSGIIGTPVKLNRTQRRGLRAEKD